MQLFGRTNRQVPPVWLSLREPATPVGNWAEDLVKAALELETVIDITQRSALWGGFLRLTNVPLMAVAGADCARAPESDVASHFVQAKLISLLSCVGRDSLDFFFLDYREPWEEWQLNGALEALETAKQDGIVQHVGLACGDNDLAALAMWQFRDAFEMILVSPGQQFESLEPLARERRAGVLVRDTQVGDYPVLRSVSTPAEVRA